MPDEPTTVQKTETVEVIGLDNQSGGTAKDLATMFDNMEANKAEGRPAVEAATEPKKEEKPADVEKSTETKTAEKQEEKVAEKAPDNKSPEDPREVLRKAMEERKARKEEAQAQKTDDKAGDKKEEDKEDDIPDDELKVLPHDKPRTAKRIKALLKKIDSVTSESTKSKAEASEKAAKLAEYEKKLAEVKTVNPETDAAVKKQQDELAMYRRRYELENDPEVKSKYDDRVTQSETSIIDTLKRRGATDALLGMIQSEGGWVKFSSSGRAYTVPAGEGGAAKTMTAAEIAESILDSVPFGDRKAIEAATIEAIQSQRDKDRYLKEEQAKASEFFKKRDEEAKKADEVRKGQVEAATKRIEEFKSTVLKSDWLQDKSVADNATQAEKAAAEEHNKYNKQLRAIFEKNVATKDLDGIFEIMTDAVRYWDERRTSNNLKHEVDRLKAELEAKNQEISRFKTAGRSVAKSGSIAVTAAAQTNTERKPRSLEDAFEILERGDKLDGSASDQE